MTITVPGSGHLALTGLKVASTSVDTVAAGAIELTIRPAKKQRRALHRRGKLRVGLKLSFTPTASTWRSILLRATKHPPRGH
jgi:hypothetical protein